MIFPVEIIDMIASYDWRVWGRLMETCRMINTFLSGSRAYKLFTRREIESDYLKEFTGPSGKTLYIGYRSYVWTTLDTQQEIKYVYYAPDAEIFVIRIEYALNNFQYTYRRVTVDGCAPKYTVEKTIKTTNVHKKIKLAPITELEWNKLVEGL